MKSTTFVFLNSFGFEEWNVCAVQCFQGVFYAKRMKRLQGYNKARELSTKRLKDIGSLLGSMGNSYLKDIPNEVVAGSIGTIKEADLSPAQVCLLFLCRLQQLFDTENIYVNFQQSILIMHKIMLSTVFKRRVLLYTVFFAHTTMMHPM